LLLDDILENRLTQPLRTWFQQNPQKHNPRKTAKTARPSAQKWLSEAIHKRDAEACTLLLQNGNRLGLDAPKGLGLADIEFFVTKAPACVKVLQDQCDLLDDLWPCFLSEPDSLQTLLPEWLRLLEKENWTSSAIHNALGHEMSDAVLRVFDTAYLKLRVFAGQALTARDVQRLVKGQLWNLVQHCARERAGLAHLLPILFATAETPTTVLMDVVHIYTEVLGPDWQDHDTLPCVVRSGNWDRVELMAHLGPKHWLFSATASPDLLLSVLQRESVFVLQRILDDGQNALDIAESVARQDSRLVTQCFLSSQGAEPEVMLAFMRGVLDREEQKQQELTALLYPFLEPVCRRVLFTFLFTLGADPLVRLGGLFLQADTSWLSSVVLAKTTSCILTCDCVVKWLFVQQHVPEFFLRRWPRILQTAALTSCRRTFEHVLLVHCSLFMRDQLIDSESAARIAQNAWSDLYIQLVALGMRHESLTLTESRIWCARDLIQHYHREIPVELILLVLSYLPFPVH
jgi:hypothetical protein